VEPNLKTKKYSWPSIIFLLPGCMHIRKLKTKRKLQNAVFFLFIFPSPAESLECSVFFFKTTFFYINKKMLQHIYKYGLLYKSAERYRSDTLKRSLNSPVRANAARTSAG
jgi:hypothetical protein